MIDIPKWDFHWQGGYQFKKLIKLPRGTVLNGEASYDNTANNPNNPSVPPKNVILGEGTENEMMLIYFWYTRYQQGDENIVLDSSWNVSVKDIKSKNTNNFTVYPNPADAYLTIEPIDNLQAINVFDISGKLMQTKPYTIQNGQLNISDLVDGLYFVQLQYTNTIVTKRFVVKHE